MEGSIEKKKPMITFKNQPKLSEDEVDKKRNELRVALVSHISNFLETDEYFQGKEVIVEFSEQGVSSLVCFIETGDKKFVLKIPLNSTVLAGDEALFLKTWEASGVSVPHVFKEGMLGTSSYLLMQYIDAPTVQQKYKDGNENKENGYFEAGKTLRVMHKQEAIGFGKVINGRGEYDSFAEWLNSGDMEKREKYIQEQHLLGEEHGSISQAKNTLINFAGGNSKSSYLHFDYSTGHLFATIPLTVFDPDPLFNNRYIDLGRTFVNYIAQTEEYPKKLLEGYCDGEEIDEKALHAAIFINIVYKIPYQHQKGRMQVIQNLQNYLIQNKYILELK